MSSWHSYPKIYNLGHAALETLFQGDVVIQEKVDGSQFSFGFIDGRLRARSKGVDFSDPTRPEKMFQKACDWAVSNCASLHPEWTYRAEYLQGPKHNTLAYDRVPQNNLIVFDIQTAEEQYLRPEELILECLRLGLEHVPYLYVGDGSKIDADFCKASLENISILGAQKIEGIVVKNYSRFGKDGKCVMGKHVSEVFKETHRERWGTDSPGNGDYVQLLADKYRTTARWRKAVQHLKERGELANEPRDIPSLMQEARTDLRAECADEIKDQLFQHFFPIIQRTLGKGLAEWYKKELMERQFEHANPV